MMPQLLNVTNPLIDKDKRLEKRVQGFQSLYDFYQIFNSL